MIQKYLSLVKFAHTIFALPFACIGFTLGTFRFSFQWSLLLWVILCMVFARSAAMAFNRYIDRKIDAKNPRTKIREIPSGKITPRNALIFTLINCLLFISVTYQINPLCFYLSPVALLVVLGYSYTKRFTALCHIVLGLGLSLAPIGAYIAVTNEFSVDVILLGLGVLFWVAGFDIIYALQDEEFDKENQLKSIPSWLGKLHALYLSRTFHIFNSIFLILFGLLYVGHWVYWIGLSVFIGLLIYQHTLVKPNDLRKVNLAFFTSNGIASMIFGFTTIGDILIFS